MPRHKRGSFKGQAVARRLDDFTRQYVETALWSTNDESDERGGEPLDKNYDIADIAPATLDAMIRDCSDFQEKHKELLEKSGIDAGQAGHWFWLSRNGHGSGFFDDGHDDLQEAAESYGPFELYVGDDGMIYGSGHESEMNEATRGRRGRAIKTQDGSVVAYAHPKASSSYERTQWVAVLTGTGAKSWDQGDMYGARAAIKEFANVQGTTVQVMFNRREVSKMYPDADRWAPTSGTDTDPGTAWGRGHGTIEEAKRIGSSGRGIPRSGDYRGYWFFVSLVDFRDPSLGHAATLFNRRGQSVNNIKGDSEEEVRTAAKTHWPGAVEKRVAGEGRRVSDFNTMKAIIDHARSEGATHIVWAANAPKAFYFPIGGGRYAEATVFRKEGYWHAQGPEKRREVRSLPRNAEPLTAQHQPTVHEGRVPEHRRRRAIGGPPGPGRGKPARPRGEDVVILAYDLSKRVDGTEPKDIGSHRWSDPNRSLIFTTYSPKHSQKVVVLVSSFNDGTYALDFFGDESLSETARYENIGHYLYRRADKGEMIADIKWVWETVDGYAESWQTEGDGEMEEARSGGGRKVAGTGRTSEAPGRKRAPKRTHRKVSRRR